VLTECFDGHTGFSIKDFVETQIKSHELVAVTLVVTEQALARLRNELLCTPVQEERLANGAVRLELLTFSMEWILGWLLRCGTAVTVEEPPELRVALRESALAIAGKYQ